MTGDSSSRIPEPAPVDLWRLPRVLQIRARRVRYRAPKQHAVGSKVVEVNEGVEIDIRTDDEFPVRALSPVLYVGATALTELERVGKNHYRFRGIAPEKLIEGAPVLLGWSGTGPGGAATKRTRTKVKFPRVEGE